MRSPDISLQLDDGRTITGFADDGYGRLVDAFVANYTTRGDLGSGCSIEVDGRLVVDLWGGTADTRCSRPWATDTAAVIFSCSKGLVSMCVYLLVQDGVIDLDAPIATYWPEFARHGKESITLRHVLTHRAGLPALDVDLTRDDVVAWAPVIAAIEAQRPLFAPDEGFVYHALTFGWLAGEVIRRVTGRTPGRFFAERIAAPLRLDTWIGLPAGRRHQVARMEAPLADEDSDEARLNAQLIATDPIVRRALTMGGAYEFPDLDGEVTFNDDDIQAAELPAANGISTPRSLARCYAACIAADAPLLDLASIADALAPRSTGRQLSATPDDGARWGTGFQLASPPTQPMLGPSSFGHAGAGGQLAFADVDRRAAFAYLSNQMGGYGDGRARELTQALDRVLG